MLCSRDAKFAVDCDTCRLSYCLVCLASGSKDPCVRCGHRPSKRMEQLVHLRLKSIYKAFKQTSHSGSGRGGGSSQHGGGSNNANSGNAPTNTTTSTNLRERQNDDPDELHVAENPEVLLQHAAASAAAKLKQATSAASGHHASSNHPRQANPGSASSAAQPSTSSSSSFLTMSATERLELYMAEKAKADKAAADLLAELDQEEEQKKKSKMSKKQKKKLKQQQGQQPQSAAPSSGERRQSDEMNDHGDNDPSSVSGRQLDRRSPSSPRRTGRDHNEEEDGEPDDDVLLSRDGAVATQGEAETALDPIEVELEQLIENEDVDGIEALLSSVKGVPGLAMLRKNAKKALKRLRVDQGDEVEPAPTSAAPHEDVKADTVSAARNTGPSKLRKSSTSGSENPNRVEWSMRVDPSIVGYVIGKGGLRIRDLMEESGARIWVDQEGLGPNEERTVCCSGYKKNVEAAIKLIIDVVERAPTALVHPKPGVGQSGGKVAVDPSKVSGEGPASSSSDRVSPSAAHRDPSKASRVLTCDPRFVPLLIGRRGWTIKNIQDSSGARVDIDQSVSPRRITVSGSEGSVEVAVRMVRDVLSYPHSQLQGAIESEKDDEEDAQPNPDSTGCAAATPQTEPVDQVSNIQEDGPEPARLSLSDAVARGANSPPSSLIMTGDAKSTVSASSSLSSTPEPSMASSLPKGGYSQVPPGPMLPPAIGLSQQEPAGSNPSHRDVQPNPYILPQESSFGLPIAPQMTNHSVVSRAAMQSLPTHQPLGTLLAGGLVSSGSQMQGPAPFVHAPGAVAGPLPEAHVAPPQLPVGGYHSELHHGPLAPFSRDSVINDRANLNLTGPLASQTGRWNGAGPQPSVQLSSSSAAVADGFRFDAAVEFLQNSKATQSSSQLVGGHPSRISASLTQRETPLLGVGQKQVAPGYSPSLNPAHVDSQIVDSLFGPTTGPVNDESMLLNGLQGLTLNKDYSQLGLWGAPPQPVDEKGLLGLGSYLTGDVQSSPADLNLGDAPALNVHHPPQSRFGW